MKSLLTTKNLGQNNRDSAWAKVINSVDLTKTNGYAFEGTWATNTQVEAQVGDIVVIGSKFNGFRAYRITESEAIIGYCIDLTDEIARIGKSDRQAGVELIATGKREEFLSFRNAIAEALGAK